jgi:hypothetical protein
VYFVYYFSRCKILRKINNLIQEHGNNYIKVEKYTSIKYLYIKRKINISNRKVGLKLNSNINREIWSTYLRKIFPLLYYFQST